MASDKARGRLADSIRQLMETSPLDAITVKAIVENCGLTRQTFYRNFRDKYDLVNWHFERLAQKSFKQMGVSCTLREGLLKKFTFLQEEWRFFNQAFRSQDYNSLVAYDYDSILAFYTGVITRKTRCPLEPDVAFLLKMYCHGSIAMTVEWVTGGMPTPPEQIAELLIEALPKRLEELLSELNP